MQMIGDTINTNVRDDGVLEIYYGIKLLAEVEDGRDEESFIADVLTGMGYVWNADGTITSEVLI